MTARIARFAAAVILAAVGISSSAAADTFSVPEPQTSPDVDVFTSSGPRRVFDSRDSGRMLRAGSTTAVSLAAAGLPTGARAALLNVTAVGAGRPGFLRVFPCGQTEPPTASVSYIDAFPVANLVISALGDGGEVCLFTSASTHAVVDINGAFTADSGYTAIVPQRVVDTRRPGSAVKRLRAGVATGIDVSALGVGATRGIAVNFTVDRQSGPGFLSAEIDRCGLPGRTDPPGTSVLNFSTAPRAATTMAISNGGSICVTSSVDTDLIVDVSGWMPPLAGDGQPPYWQVDAGHLNRVLDTRPEGHRPGWPTAVAAGSSTPVEWAPFGGGRPDAGFVTIAVTNAQAPGFATVYPCGTAVPPTSTVNFAPGMTVANTVAMQRGADGRLCVYSSAAADVIVDSVATMTATAAPFTVYRENSCTGSFSAQLLWLSSDAPNPTGIWFLTPQPTGGVGPYTIEVSPPAPWTARLVGEVLVFEPNGAASDVDHPVTIRYTDAAGATVEVGAILRRAQRPAIPILC